MVRIKGCVIGLKDKIEVIRILYELVKKVDLEEKIERFDISFAVFKYYDVYRNKNYLALVLGERYPFIPNKDRFFYFKNKINAGYYKYSTWDNHCTIMTKRAKKYFEQCLHIDDPFEELDNKIAYIEQNKKLVINKITEICCDRTVIKQIDELVSSSNFKKPKNGICDVEDSRFNPRVGVVYDLKNSLSNFNPGVYDLKNSLSNFNSGVYDLKNKSTKKFLMKSLYHSIEEIVNERWNPEPIED